MVIIIKKGTPEAAIRQLLAQLSMQNVKGGCVAGAESILLPLVAKHGVSIPMFCRRCPSCRRCAV